MSKKSIKDSDRKRHKRVYQFFRSFVCGPICKKFNFSGDTAPQINGNFLLLCNHNTDFDFFLVGSRFKQHMYFVASEHIYHNKILGSLLARYFAPIARVKGTTASSTVMNIIRTLRRGDNVCIFAEGNRSFNGLTCPILFSTGKLAKASGVHLVTYRFEGGYFTTPRWSYSLRRGIMRGSVVNIYSPEQLNAMSDGEINSAISSDLYEDAYAKQAVSRTKYSGKRLAEGLEHILYICPECGSIGTMKSKGDKLSCLCKMSASYDEYGTIHNARFPTVTEWDSWQVERLHEYIDSCADDDILFFDDNAMLYTVDSSHRAGKPEKNTLSMTKKELRFGKHIFPLSELSGQAIYGRCTLVFMCDNIHYEIKSKGRLCSLKYLQAYNYIVNQCI